MSPEDPPAPPGDHTPNAPARAWSWRLVVGVLAVAAVVVVVIAWLGDLFGERTTLGTIVVGSPAVYTRERLVNDRLLQDAWLSAQLDPDGGVRDALAFLREVREGLVSLGERKEDAPAAPGAPPTRNSAAPDAPGAVPAKDPAAAAPGEQPRLSSRTLLLEKVDYREVVRSLIIENQLDDSHDLNGNSLYRLKFDASVLPGANTQASALITVLLLSPEFLTPALAMGPLDSPSALGKPADVAAWQRIYVRWIANLDARLNQTHTELKLSYRNNEFSHNGYAHLIGFLSRLLDVGPARVRDCAGQLETVRSAERLGVRLSTEEHVARKRCIEALVAQHIPDTVIMQLRPPKDVRVGEYLPQDAVGARVTDKDRPARTHQNMEFWLNAFFASSTVKLVLGLEIADRYVIQDRYYDIPAFQNLARLTFFARNTRPDDGRSVFEVSEKAFSVSAIDPRVVTTVEQLRRAGGATAEHSLEDFVVRQFAPRFRVSQPNLDAIRAESIALSEADFEDVSSGNGIYAARAPVGLLQFAKEARKHMAAFTYGVTPKESADSLDVIRGTDARVGGQTGVGDAGTAAAQLGRQASSRAVERRNAVVGFARSGVADKKSRSTEFGWVISPRLARLDGMRHVWVQAPAQYSLSALVSIPSWWGQARFQITTSWLDGDGRPIAHHAADTYTVELPMDFEPLEAMLLGIEQLGPELMESRLDAVVLRACQPGAIVIPGRRLWRSTKVTLGYQTADAISVLPNMKGIIARFDTVQNQITPQEDANLRAQLRKTGADTLDIQRPVRVWTSQGSLTLPASIGVRADTPATCPPPPKPGADARPKAPPK